VERLIALAASAPSPEVRAIASYQLGQLRNRLSKTTSADYRPMNLMLAADITRFLERPAEAFRPVPVSAAPPGAPIGEPPYQWLPPYGTGTIWWNWWDEIPRR
jgi:hypothetical protein